MFGFPDSTEVPADNFEIFVCASMMLRARATGPPLPCTDEVALAECRLLAYEVNCAPCCRACDSVVSLAASNQRCAPALLSTKKKARIQT